MSFVPKISEPPKPGSLRLQKKEPRIEIGSEIFRRFVLTQELGKGRCSTSWLVDDPRFRRDVVLKLFRSANEEGTEEERAIWRDFLRRLRILNHPDIVITMEFFHEGSWLALSSTYENGPTLAAVTLQAGKRFPHQQILDVLKTVGGALAAAHDKCLILHGNINAFNILLPTRRRSAKITDFGFHPPLPPLDEANDTPELSWKLACLSPERLQGESPSHPDDIYAFAAVAFQLFSGQNPPLDAFGHLDKAAAEALLVDAPGKWPQQLLNALSPNPADRPETLSILLQELDLYEDFNPRKEEIERSQTRTIPTKRLPRNTKTPDNLRPKSTLLFRLAIIFAVIAAPSVVGWIIYNNLATNRALREERFKAEAHERAQEAAENAMVLQLNDRLGGNFGPSKSNLDLYRQTMSEPAATPKPTPLVINTGARDFFREGQAKIAAGNPSGAMESYELAIVLQQDWPDLLDARGAALLALQKPAAAISEFSKALIIEPGRVSALIGRSNAYLANQDKSAAAADLQTALKIEPENAEIKSLLEKNNLPLRGEPGVIK